MRGWLRQGMRYDTGDMIVRCSASLGEDKEKWGRTQLCLSKQDKTRQDKTHQIGIVAQDR